MKVIFFDFFIINFIIINNFNLNSFYAILRYEKLGKKCAKN